MANGAAGHACINDGDGDDSGMNEAARTAMTESKRARERESA